jgi:hypothetical protein
MSEPEHKIPVVKPNFPSEYKKLTNLVSSLIRTQRVQNEEIKKLKEKVEEL